MICSCESGRAAAVVDKGSEERGLPIIIMRVSCAADR